MGNVSEAHKKPYLSIIIPVYDVLSYLPSCIKSILSQNFDDYEILLIDDGSVDGSAILCDDLASKYKCIKTYHKQNGGVSSARNVGIKNAQGSWLYFCDADDELLPGGLDLLINHSMENIIGMVMGGYQICTEDRELYYSEDIEVCEILGYDETVELMFHSRYYDYQGYLWNKLFRRDIVLNFSIRFNENIYFNEDRLFIVQYLCACRKDTIYFTRPVYLYFKRKSGVIQSLKKEFNYKFLTDFKAFLLMDKVVRESKCSGDVLNAIDFCIADSYIRIKRFFKMYHIDENAILKSMYLEISNRKLVDKIWILRFKILKSKFKRLFFSSISDDDIIV